MTRLHFRRVKLYYFHFAFLTGKIYFRILTSSSTHSQHRKGEISISTFIINYVLIDFHFSLISRLVCVCG